MLLPAIQSELDSLMAKKVTAGLDPITKKWATLPQKVSGLYWIYTDMPITKIINLPSRPRNFTNGQGKTARNNHICFSQRIKDNTPLLNKGIAISQNNEQLYCIYNGYRTNLRQRVTEHLGIVNLGTACLSIRDSYHYQDSLLNFKWQIEFVEVNLSKTNLIVLEQAWRSVHGWPMLCSQ